MKNVAKFTNEDKVIFNDKAPKKLQTNLTSLEGVIKGKDGQNYLVNVGDEIIKVRSSFMDVAPELVEVEEVTETTGIFNKLSVDDILEMTPAVGTMEGHQKVSSKYIHIPTTKIIEDLGNLGWHPVKTKQRGARKDSGNDGFQFHVITFRNPDMEMFGDSYPEIVITNSHNASSAFNFHAGLFRLVCANGLVVADKSFGQLRITHKGYSAEKVLETITAMTKNLPIVLDSVKKFQEFELDQEQQEQFALEAASKRWKLDKTDIETTDLLKVRREADKGNDMWSVFNRVQENIMKGGVTVKRDGKKDLETKEVKGAKADLKINKRLWELAEDFIVA